MRPKKLSADSELTLVKIYEKVKSDLKSVRSCNQYQIAKKIKDLFSDLVINELEYLKEPLNPWHARQLDVDAMGIKAASIERVRNELTRRFEVTHFDIWNITYYINGSSPAAIVQMVKRIKKTGTKLA